MICAPVILVTQAMFTIAPSMIARGNSFGQGPSPAFDQVRKWHRKCRGPKRRPRLSTTSQRALAVCERHQHLLYITMPFAKNKLNYCTSSSIETARPDVYLEVQHPCWSCNFWPVRRRTPGGRVVAEHAHKAAVDLVDDLLTSLCHVHPYLAAFGQIPAGSCRCGSRCFPRRQLEYGRRSTWPCPARRAAFRGGRTRCRCRATLTRAGRQRREHVQLRPDARRRSCPERRGPEEPWSSSTSVCRLHPTPMTLSAPNGRTRSCRHLRRAFGDGHSAGIGKRRRPPAASLWRLLRAPRGRHRA